jgi:hypothetical protein
MDAPRTAVQLEAVKQRLVTVNEQVVTFVKAHPAACLLGALALGWLAGRAARGGSDRAQR